MNFIQRIILVNSFFHFIVGDYGNEYEIGLLQKCKLVIKILILNRKTICEKYKRFIFYRIWEHLTLVKEILSLPKSLSGDVIECGCWYGRTTICLSWACALTRRKLIVCDSFKGLPQPREDEDYTNIGFSNPRYWREGDYSCGLEVVKNNIITRGGNIEICEFIEGYFQDTLKNLPCDSVVMVFEDADLVSSVECCLKYLWPKLQDTCKFFSHEPWSFGVVSLFFNKEWWRKELAMFPPGFCGSSDRYGLGYATKVDAKKLKNTGQN